MEVVTVKYIYIHRKLCPEYSASVEPECTQHSPPILIASQVNLYNTMDLRPLLFAALHDSFDLSARDRRCNRTMHLDT